MADGAKINGVAIGDISEVIYVPIGNIGFINGITLNTPWTPVYTTTAHWLDASDSDSWSATIGGALSAITDKSDYGYSVAVKGTIGTDNFTQNGLTLFNQGNGDNGTQAVDVAVMPTTITAFIVANVAHVDTVQCRRVRYCYWCASVSSRIE